MMFNTEDQKTETDTRPNSTRQKLGTTLKIFLCVTVLVLSVAVWLSSGRSWIAVLLLTFPVYLCEEWLSQALFKRGSRWSTAESGFSIVRILVGVVVVVSMNSTSVMGAVRSFHEGLKIEVVRVFDMIMGVETVD